MQHRHGAPALEFLTSFVDVFQDVGQAILESYSRVLESLAYNILTCIDDVLFADEAARKMA
jgi:hypothetical protein